VTSAPSTTARRGLVARLLLYRGLDDFVLIYPLYAVLFRDRGLDALQISTLLIIWSVVSLVAEVPSGALADRTSRRALLVWAQVLRGAGFGAWLLVPDYAGFAAGFVLWGLGGSLVSGTYEALVYDELDAVGATDRYASVIGRVQSVSLSAVAAATLLASPVAVFGYDALLLASIGACAAAAASVALLPPRPPRAEAAEEHYLDTLRQGVRIALRVPALARLVALGAVAGGLYGAVEEYFGLYVDDRATVLALVPLGLGVIYASAAIAGWSAGRFGGWAPPRVAVLVAASGALLMIAGFGPGLLGLAVISAYTFAANLSLVLADARLQDAVGDGPRATITSVAGFGMEALAVGTYLTYGLVAERYGTAAALAVCGAITAVLGLLILAMPGSHALPAEDAEDVEDAEDAEDDLHAASGPDPVRGQ